MASPSTPKKRIAPPKGTRDLYPEDTLRTRYIQKAWRDTSIRCGFDEIEGPTFEQSELYAVKSGEGILGELFQAFSGKSEEEIAAVRETGRAPFALRPEFTPTLARMYAAKAGSLPKPCKWFTAGPYFRAERPQRGRLREFLQWNVDVIGLPGEGSNTAGTESTEAKAAMDAECIECCHLLMSSLGFRASLGQYEEHIRFRISDRNVLAGLLVGFGVNEDSVEAVFAVFDRAEKVPAEEARRQLVKSGVPAESVHLVTGLFDRWLPLDRGWGLIHESLSREQQVPGRLATSLAPLRALHEAVCDLRLAPDCAVDMRIVRGLAYYTGAVFELSAPGERAVAGGGRYDNLIELMGGPPTPAVGFAMGDVVLGLLLEDKGLMPEGRELMDALSAPPASVRPEAFVVPNGDDDNEPLARRLVADLRRGVESKAHQDLGTDGKPWNAARYEAKSDGVRPLHARQTYKSTRNLKKLLPDAEKQFARFAVVVHGEDKVQLKNLDERTDLTPDKVPGMGGQHAEFCVRPDAPNYVGRAIAALC